MSDPFIGEIRAFGFHFAPRGWAFCNGQLIPIQQNTALFSLIGTYYGGNGTTNFGLPNFQNTAPMHQGNGAGLTPRVIGEIGGETGVTVQLTEMPTHNHLVTTAAANVAGQATGTPDASSYMSGSNPGAAYNPAPPSLDLKFSPKAVGFNGGSQPHNNVQPLLTLNFCIATVGIFPARN